MGQIIGNTRACLCMLRITIEHLQQQQERQCLRLVCVCVCILFVFQSHLSLNVSLSIVCEHRLQWPSSVFISPLHIVLHFLLARMVLLFSYSSLSSAVSPSLVVFSFARIVCRLSLCKRFPNCVHAHSTANSVMATHNCTDKNIDLNRQ